MEANKLYEQLENDFITKEIKDERAIHMLSVNDFLSKNFKKRSMGVVCDFTKEINKVFTAVFPSKEVMQRILNENIKNAMLFVHHPSIWDIRKAPEVFQQMDRKLLNEFKNRNISIYNLHTPLDNYSPYSTSMTLAKILGINPETTFAPYFGAMCGIFGKTKTISIKDLKDIYEKAIGHEVKLYDYGKEIIENGTVAIIAGGGNSIDMLEEISKAGINTFITGITAKNEHSEKAHNFAEKHKINILGGTHYSSEKFACIAMIDYFRKAGLVSEFIEDTPVIEDM